MKGIPLISIIINRWIRIFIKMRFKHNQSTSKGNLCKWPRKRSTSLSRLFRVLVLREGWLLPSRMPSRFKRTSKDKTLIWIYNLLWSRILGTSRNWDIMATAKRFYQIWCRSSRIAHLFMRTSLKLMSRKLAIVFLDCQTQIWGSLVALRDISSSECWLKWMNKTCHRKLSLSTIVIIR